MSSNKCPNCSNSVRTGSSVVCDGCRADVHLTCVGLNADDVRMTRNKSKALKIICNDCQKLMGELGDIKSILMSLKDDFEKRFSNIEAKINQANFSNIQDIKTSLENLQKEIIFLRSDKPDDNTCVPIYEEVIQEISERERRKTNLIVFGIPEQTNVSPKEKVAHDLLEIQNLLKAANCPPNHEIKAFRIGKESTTNTIRPIKVILPSEKQVHAVIKKAKELRSNSSYKSVSISFDRTPKQIDHYRQLKKNLEERMKNGETNLKIKYTNGYPKIVHLNQ